MPSFVYLSDEEIEKLVSYVIHLSLRGEVEFTLCKELLGDEDPLTLESLDRLRSLHQDLGDLVQAEPLLQKVVELRKRLLSEFGA